MQNYYDELVISLDEILDEDDSIPVIFSNAADAINFLKSSACGNRVSQALFNYVNNKLTIDEKVKLADLMRENSLKVSKKMDEAIKFIFEFKKKAAAFESADYYERALYNSLLAKESVEKISKFDDDVKKYILKRLSISNRIGG